jgi:hypothetical protein
VNENNYVKLRFIGFYVKFSRKEKTNQNSTLTSLYSLFSHTYNLSKVRERLRGFKPLMPPLAVPAVELPFAFLPLLPLARCLWGRQEFGKMGRVGSKNLAEIAAQTFTIDILELHFIVIIIEWKQKNIADVLFFNIYIGTW